MKSVKLELPQRLHKQLKIWLLDCEQTQADMFCYLIDNLPPVPALKPKSDLLNYLGITKNVQELRKNVTADDLRMWELIGRGIVKPTPDEVKLIQRLTKINIDQKR